MTGDAGGARCSPNSALSEAGGGVAGVADEWHVLRRNGQLSERE